VRFRIVSDADQETGLHDISDEINRSPMDDFFVHRQYDDLGISIGVVLMGRDPGWNFQQRISFSKKENKLYMDLMFDWHSMVGAKHSARKRIVAEKMITEIPQIIAKKRFKDFDLPRFSSDLREWFEVHGWINPEFPEVIS